jgi:hypothetical protein
MTKQSLPFTNFTYKQQSYLLLLTLIETISMLNQKQFSYLKPITIEDNVVLSFRRCKGTTDLKTVYRFSSSFA